MNLTRWSLIAALPLASVVVTDVLRSEQPLFWAGAATGVVLTLVVFFDVVLRPIQSRVQGAGAEQRDVPSRRAIISLVGLTVLCAAAIGGLPHSGAAAPLFLAVVLTPVWTQARSKLFRPART